MSVAAIELDELLGDDDELALGEAVELELNEPEVDPFALVVEDGEVAALLDPLNEAVLPIEVPLAAELPELDVEGAWAEAAGAGELAEVPGVVELVELDDGVLADCEVVVSEDFFLFMSPRARALPLASTTIEVRIKAGASLRI
ncbi:MAG TPA: hypothetical protein VM073_07445 [Usitatibacter sp.]|nr:hypothetical protein [Usitatibacter sp.]